MFKNEIAKFLENCKAHKGNGNLFGNEISKVELSKKVSREIENLTQLDIIDQQIVKLIIKSIEHSFS